MALGVHNFSNGVDAQTVWTSVQFNHWVSISWKSGGHLGQRYGSELTASQIP